MNKANTMINLAAGRKQAWLCAFVAVASLATACLCLSDGPSTSTEEQEQDMDSRFTQVFWGTLEVRESETGRSYWLVNMTSALGETPSRFSCPMLGLRVVDSAWPEGRPSRYVAGRRYMVFKGYRTDGGEDAAGETPELLRMIDLDETTAEAALQAALNATYGSSVLPGLPLASADQEAVTVWSEEVAELVASGGVSLGDVLHVLGRPDKVSTATLESATWRATYLLKTEMLTSTSEILGGVRRSCPRVIFTLSGQTVTGFEADSFTESHITDPRHLRTIVD